MMARPFNADEVFEIAEQIERNGARFYRAAAKRFPALSEVLTELARMEDTHEQTFAAMHAELSTAEQRPAVFDPDQQSRLYLQAVADGKVFDTGAEPAEQLAGCESARDVLAVAIGLEKESVVFYTSIKAGVSQKAGKDKVEAIIAEETSHIVTLTERLEGLE